MSWIPKRTLREAEAILCAPGQLHELETRLVDGRIQRVYKNLWPSLRDFWLWVAQEYKHKTYVVFEKDRISYEAAFERSVKAASVFRHVYGVKKGDRVVICSRNIPDYLVALWACQLIGAVSVFVNAWLPAEPTKHCFVSTRCKLVILDSPRADLVESFAGEVAREAGTSGFLVWQHWEGKGNWDGMQIWSNVLDSYQGELKSVLDDPGLLPEDPATISFTSGTTGLPKGVLSTHRMFLTNVLNVLAGPFRAILRRGGSLPQFPLPDGPQKGILVSVPLFHVTGLTSLALLGTMTGMKIVFMRKWDAEEGARLIRDEYVTIAGGVPSMVADLSETSAAGHPLESLLFGGASAPDWLAKQSRKAFPTATMTQGYGLTESNSVAVGFAAEDYHMRPTSAGLAMPVNDVLIVKDDIVLPPGELGEVWLRGPNIMKEYYGDPRATSLAITKDGWLRSGDIGLLDHEGFLYIRDRIKDLIIRGGENIDSVSVENAVSADDRLLEVAAVGVPDPRLGELVSVVASVKPAYQGKVLEQEVIDIASQRLPHFAVPVMVFLQNERLPRNPSGKILKRDLRDLAKEEWVKRTGRALDSKAKL